MAIFDLFASSDDPKYPGLVLTLHVIAKSVEMGTLLGLAIGVLGGTADLVFKKENPLIKVMKVCELGACIGTAFGLFSILMKANRDPTMDADGIHERSYRLVHSQPGIKHLMDVRFLTGGMVGSLVFGLLVPERWVKLDFIDRAAQGFCVGGAIGILDIGSKVANKMLHKQLEMM